MDFIETLEGSLNLKAIKNFNILQPGDVIDTEANTSRLEDYIGFKPQISLKEGLADLLSGIGIIMKSKN